MLVTSEALESVAKDKGEFTAMLRTCYLLLQQGGYTLLQHMKSKICIKLVLTLKRSSTGFTVWMRL